MTYGQELGITIPLQYPASLGLRYDARNWVHALILNGNTYGGRTGTSTGERSLGTNDYWSEFEVHSQVFVDRMRFKSNQGITIEGGGQGGNVRQTVRDTRIARVGGSTNGIVLTQLIVEYVENYHASKLVEKDVRAIFDFTPGGTKTKSYTDRSLTTVQVYQRMTEKSTELTVNASAQAEFFAKFSESTGVISKSISREDIKLSSEEAVKSGKEEQDEIPLGWGEFLVSSVTIMQDSDGNYWTYPTGEQKWIKLPDKQFRDLVGAYDFTSVSDLQTGLGHEQSYGFNRLVSNVRR